MTDNLVKLELVTVGDGFRFDPNEVLEQAKARGFTNLVIIGELPGEDDLYVAGMANAGEALILMEKAKLQVIKG
jgi:hypothetical protein